MPSRIRSESSFWSARNFGLENPPFEIPITALVSRRTSVAVRAMTVKSLDHLAELAKASGTPVKTLAMMHEDGLFGTTVAGHVEKHAKNLPARIASTPT